MKKYTWTGLLFQLAAKTNGTCMKNLKVPVISQATDITREPIKEYSTYMTTVSKTQWVSGASYVTRVLK